MLLIRSIARALTERASVRKKRWKKYHLSVTSFGLESSSLLLAAGRDTSQPVLVVSSNIND